MVYIFVDKKSTGSGIANNEINQKSAISGRIPQTNYQKLFKKKQFIQDLKTIFGDDDLAEMQLISKLNKRLRFLLCVIDIFSEYAWAVPLKDKKGVSTVNEFKKILKEFNRT